MNGNTRGAPSRLGRMDVVVVAIGLLFAILLIAAANLQVVRGEQYIEAAEKAKVRTIVLRGSRGTIYDRNGLPLAYDEPSYDVEFLRDPGKKTTKDNAEYSKVLLETIAVIEENGGKTISSFNIKMQEDGTFAFDFGDCDEAVFAARKEAWMRNMLIAERDWKHPAQWYWDYLRTKRYMLPEDISYEQSYKLLSIWQEATQASYTAYLPIKISYDVSFTTVATLAARSYELPGIGVGQDTRRVYPRGTSAAHIVGYTGRMYEQDVARYTDKKGDYRYAVNDIVGLMGLEASQEAALSRNVYTRLGRQVIQVDNKGNIIHQESYLAAQNGNDIVSTIDAEFQRVVERALEQNVKATEAYQRQRYQEQQETFDAIIAERGRPIEYAKMGAAVVLDVRTGEVLALANYPSFDPNLFVGGISHEAYTALAEDPALPLYNKAIASRAHPGSIYKMVTGFAALCAGKTNVNEVVSDEGEFVKHLGEGSSVHGPRCWVRPNYNKHAELTIVGALRTSCNYYFYEMAHRMGAETLQDWAAKFGLTSKTGIELGGELASQVGGQQALFDPAVPAAEQTSTDARLVYRGLVAYLTGVFADMGIVLAEGRIESAVAAMMQTAVTTEGNYGPFVRDTLTTTLGLPYSVMSSQGIYRHVNEQLYNILWNSNRTLMASIGQDLTMITPIAAARYVAAVANGGLVYECHIVKRELAPDGRVVRETRPRLIEDLNLPPEFVAAVKEGMREVVSDEDGTATEDFRNFLYLSDMAGKTGSAQVSSIDIEQNAWFVAYAPFEKPEIAIAIYIPQGSSGAKNSLAIREIVSYWMTQRDNSNNQSLVPGNGFAG